MKRFFRGAGMYLLLLVAILALTGLFSGGWGQTMGEQKELSYSPQFLDLVRQGKIDRVIIVEGELKGLYKDSSVREADFPDRTYDFKTRIPDVAEYNRDVKAVLGLSEDASMKEYGFDTDFGVIPAPSFFMTTILPIIIMAVLIGGIWYFVMAQQSGGGGKVMNFGKSRARVMQDPRHPVTFEDVQGLDEEKEELSEIVQFLKNPRRFLDLGARIPKGVLLVGPPGTGKTLLARAVAGEAGVPFFSISGSDFVEMFVGVGASRVRDLFEQAKKNVPCIVFIDEIDAVGRQRGAGLGGGHDEREQTLNQLLVEMDGFTTNEGIIILAATNRADILDPALLRPGRFDRQIAVHQPDIKGRESILRLYAKGKPIAPDVDYKVIAKMTPWFSGADLENVMNEAALLTARRGRKQITMQEMLESVNRVYLGPEKKSRVVTEKDKKLVAYHEAGHAIVAHLLPNCDPVQEVSIIPRGKAGGYTQTLPAEDTQFITKGRLLDNIAMSMGGHAAEKLIFNDVTTGSSSDLHRATETARSMIAEYGMSDSLGPVYLGGGREVFIGRDFSTQATYSEDVAAKIDQEVKKVLESGYSRAYTILSDNIEKLHELVRHLLEKEKIDGQEFVQIMQSNDHKLGIKSGMLPDPV